MVKYLLALTLLFVPASLGSAAFPPLRVFQNYPSSVRVGSYDYDIHYVADLYSDKGERLLGMCDLNKKQIYIKMPDPEIESTIVHEFIHAMVFENGFDMDERSVLKMESALYKFLKDNYKLKNQ